MNWNIVGFIVGPLMAFVGSEIMRRIAASRLEGEHDATAKALAKDFENFRDRTEKMLEKIWTKLDSLAEKTGPHLCVQVASISAMQTQITTNTERFLRMEQRVHELEMQHQSG